jgi:hypothetical protein
MTIAIGQKKKALIHIAKEDLHLDEESYRQILKGVAGVESSTQLAEEGFEKVMRRFQEMGFRGLLPDPYQPVPKGRLIPPESSQGQETITPSQLGFVFCQRIIKRPEPLTKRDGQKMIIGLMAILRQRTIKKRRIS